MQLFFPRAEKYQRTIFHKTQENLRRHSKERNWFGEMLKLVASACHPSLVMPLERAEREWREWERGKSTCYWAIPINYQTSSRKRGQFITFDEAKKLAAGARPDESNVEHNLCHSWIVPNILVISANEQTLL